jgi:hypothetical protein
MQSPTDRTFQQQWQQSMGALDSILDDARANVHNLARPDASLADLLRQAEGERAAAEATLRRFAEQREQLALTLEEVQRQVAVAGVPLRGEIS